jgi:hypothetical protein
VTENINVCRKNHDSDAVHSNEIITSSGASTHVHMCYKLYKINHTFRTHIYFLLAFEIYLFLISVHIRDE